MQSDFHHGLLGRTAAGRTMGRPLRVVLARLPSRTTTYDPEIQECLGIEALASVLRTDGHDVLLLDADLQQQPLARMTASAAAFGPDMVGVSLMSGASLPSLRSFATGILSERPAATLVAGGQLFISDPAALRRCEPVRMAVRFEGEQRVRDLVEAHGGTRPLDHIPNLVRMRPDGTLVGADLTADVPQLDDLPFPARDFAGVLRSWQLPANVQGSRGCAKHCTFCLTPVDPATCAFGWRGRSPEHLVSELEELHGHHGFCLFNFVDDDFLGPPAGSLERATRIAVEILRRGLRVRFGIQCRAGDVPIAAFEALRRAGLAYVFVGVETADAKTGMRFGKPLRPAHLTSTIATLRDLGIHVEAGLIPFHPWSTPAQLRRDYEFLTSTRTFNVRTALNRLLVFRETPIARLVASMAARCADDESGDGVLSWTFEDESVTAFADALCRAVAAVQPLWTLVAVMIPPVLLEADRAPGGEAAPVAASLLACRHSLDDWVERTAWALLRQQNPRDLHRESEHAAAEGRRLALDLARAMGRVSYGRMTGPNIQEVAHLTSIVPLDRST